ncbi:MAG: hypothetical protein R3E50_00885 [Halioglobus sp.]
MGPAMTRMVGRIADGMITHPPIRRRYIREVCLPRLRKVSPAAGGPGSFKLVLGLTATGKDEAEVAASWGWRNLLGFTFSTPAYWPSLELFGWQDRASSCWI